MTNFSKQVVSIFGAPRSGTSWLGQILNSAPNVAYRFQPLFSYAFKNRVTNNSSPADIELFYRELLETEDDFVLQRKNISGRDEIHFQKEEISHLVWKEVRYHSIIEHLLNSSPTQIIGIVRHPCAVINSWLRAPKEFDSSWNPLQEWRYAIKKNQNKPEEYNGYEKWKELAFLYLNLRKKYPEQFYLVKYEELNLRPFEEGKKLFDFLELKWNRQTEEFIKKSKETYSDDPYGVFRANQENDSWRKELNKDIVEEILIDEDYKNLNDHYKW